MNSVQIVGNLTRDPEYRQLQSGVNVCTFTVACQRKYKNQQTGQYDADFISCTAWRQTADFVHKHFIKGNRIGLNGSIQTGSYTAQDGSKRYTTEVVVDNVEFVAPRQDSGGNRYGSPPPPDDDGQADEARNYPSPPQQTELDTEDELPF